MLLSINKLISGYEDKKIINGLNLEIDFGEIVAIIGANGSGKSTVLKSIFNLCSIYSGSIFWKDGKNITNLPTYKKILNGISYVPQGEHIFNQLTVQENLEMGAFVLKNKKLKQRRIDKIYSDFDFLKNKKNDLSATLSGGQQQILAIAMALMQNPQLLLLDEPSLGLSPKFVNEIFDNIVSINKKGVSIIIVEQNVDKVLEIADKVYVINNGKAFLKD